MVDSQWSPNRSITNWQGWGYYDENGFYIEYATYFRRGLIYTGMAYTRRDPQENWDEFYYAVTHTTGGSTAYGVDCSGFVSLSWRLPKRYNSGDLECDAVNARHDCSNYRWLTDDYVISLAGFGQASNVNLLPGDVLNYPGHHTILFSRYLGNGILEAMEQLPASPRRSTWAYSQLIDYRPIRRQMITNTHSWDFDIPSNPIEGWTAVNAEQFFAENGFLILNPGASDPQVISPPIVENPANSNILQIRMASNAPDGEAAVYFTVQGGSNFSEDKKVPFPLVNEPGGTARYYEYVVPMLINPNWAGTITRIRIDPSETGIPGSGHDAVGFDYIKLTHSSLVTANQASSAGNSGSKTATPGQMVSAWLDVKNSGSSVWSGALGYALGWVSGGSAPSPDWIGLAPGELIKPGETRRWNLTFAAPLSPGPNTITWQMAQDFVQRFGDPMALNLTVVTDVPLTANNLRVSKGDYPFAVHLEWSSSPDADGYKVFRREGTADYALIGTTGTTVFNDRTAEVGKTYGYCIKAYNVIGDSLEACDSGFVLLPPQTIIYIPFIQNEP